MSTQYQSPQIMAVLNITPDSFSDGGHFISVDAAFAQARKMVAEGADIIDIGGESTRPNAKPVSIQEELDRVIPILEKIRAELPITISVDTSKAEVMQAAIEAGANIINDVNALRGENCLKTVAAHSDIKVCLMHMQGNPTTMQQHPHYKDVVEEIKTFLLNRIQACLEQGIAHSRIIIDVGFGFGKTLEHNLQIMNQLQIFTGLGYPVLIGVSRKSMIGQVLGKETHERLYGGLALAVLAVQKGATIIRTHDVAPLVDALKMAHAVLELDNHSNS